jgi:hypothetical protein
LVELSEGVAVATQVEEQLEDDHPNKDEEDYSHITTGTELTEGRHFWEVELLSRRMDGIYVGVTRPILDPEGGCSLQCQKKGALCSARAGMGYLLPYRAGEWVNDPGNSESCGGAHHSRSKGG